MTCLEMIGPCCDAATLTSTLNRIQPLVSQTVGAPSSIICDLFYSSALRWFFAALPLTVSTKEHVAHGFLTFGRDA